MPFTNGTTAEARDEKSEAKKPVIEVITTVYQMVNKRVIEPRLDYYGYEDEMCPLDEGAYEVNTDNLEITDMTVHSKHLSK